MREPSDGEGVADAPPDRETKAVPLPKVEADCEAVAPAEAVCALDCVGAGDTEGVAVSRELLDGEPEGCADGVGASVGGVPLTSAEAVRPGEAEELPEERGVCVGELLANAEVDSTTLAEPAAEGAAVAESGGGGAGGAVEEGELVAKDAVG